MLNESSAQDRLPSLTRRTPARTEKVAQRLARQILRDITESAATVGSRLPSEIEMSERYGVGRGSLREALRILEVQGLITIKSGPGGGPIVSGVSTQHLGATAALHLQFIGATLQSVADARLVLEPVLARQAAEQKDGPAIERLLALVQEVEVHPDDTDRNLLLARDFHTSVMHCAGNPVLTLIGAMLKDIWTDRLSGTLFPPERQGYVHEVHHEIALAVAAGRPKKAEDLMRTHMEEFVRIAQQRYPGLMEERVAWR